MVKQGDVIGVGCGYSNNGLEVSEMAEVITDKGLHLWLIMHTTTQAKLALNEDNRRTNLPMDAVTENDLEKRSPIIVIYPKQIAEVVQPVYPSRRPK